MSDGGNFVDEDVEIDFSSISGLDLERISCIEHVVLFAAINGRTLDEELFNSLLCASSFYPNIRSALVEGISAGHLLDCFVRRSEFVKNVFRLYIGPARWFPTRLEWAFIAWHGDNSPDRLQYASRPQKETWMFDMLDALFRNSPPTVVRFYDENKTRLHASFPWFVVWIKTKLEAVSAPGGRYEKLASAALGEIRRQNETAKFLQ